MTPKRAAIANRKDLDAATRAAWLSYIGGYTQADIAKRLHTSQAKVHRLIQLAHREQLIKVFIEGEPAECIALEEDLVQHFGLRSCVVAPDLGDDSPEAAFAAVGTAGAAFLHRLFADLKGAMVGVGKGRSLTALVDRLPGMQRPDLRFVSISGSLTRNLSANPYDVVLKLMERTHGEGYFLPVPYLAATSEEKDLLLAQPSVTSLLERARAADLYVVGIGAREDSAHVRQVGMVSDHEWSELARLGAVGDFMGSFIDIDGRPVPSPVNAHRVGLGLADLTDRRVVAVAGGAHKAEAILAALRTDTITDLVLGEAAARQVVEQLQTDGQPEEQSA